jgi:hypothetical protein
VVCRYHEGGGLNKTIVLVFARVEGIGPVLPILEGSRCACHFVFGLHSLLWQRRNYALGPGGHCFHPTSHPTHTAATAIQRMYRSYVDKVIKEYLPPHTAATDIQRVYRSYNNGGEEEEAAVDIVEDKGEDFATGPTSICWDDTATMMDAPPPLLTRCPLPLLGLPLRQDDRTAGAKNVVASATTAAKVGIVARATSSSGAVTYAMDVVALRQSCNDIDNSDDNNDQCR